MLKTNCEDFNSELLEVVHLFLSVFELDDNYEINLDYKELDGTIFVSVIVSYAKETKKYEYSLSLNDVLNTKKILKVCLYYALSDYFNKNMPYGALTGIRPTKLAWDLKSKGKSMLGIKNFLSQIYRVSDEKIDLIFRIMSIQKPYIVKNNKDIDLYINIPFCTTRCSYCSFISAEVGKCKELIPNYVDALIREINGVKEIIKNNSYIVRNIYIGGGTPTSIPLSQLERILQQICYKNAGEFTVEAGRSDTITKETLDLLKKYNVTRISINPQTFNDKVLQKIGRKATSEQTIECFNLARKYDFKINMDFIAGLEGDTLKSFKNSIDTAIKLRPDNITVHSLSLKRASINKEKNINIFKNDAKATKMLQYSTKALINKNYEPYYMYRQKNMLGGLENIGFTLNNSACKFNINSMEEICSCIACGANAISKKIFSSDNRIERQANNKDIVSYIEKIDEYLKKKSELF